MDHSGTPSSNRQTKPGHRGMGIPPEDLACATTGGAPMALEHQTCHPRRPRSLESAVVYRI